jgi:hypothetical protein
MSYTITTKDGITIDNIPDDIDPNSQELKDRVAKIRADNQMDAPVEIAPEPDLTLNRVGELLSRGATPTVAGATIGSVAGPAGALVGSMAVPIGDALNTIVNELSKGNTAVENYIRGLMGREQTATPMQLPMVSSMVSRGMEKIGMGAEPTSTTERVIEAGGSGLSGVGTQLPALTQLAKEGASAVTRNVASQMAQAPKTQVAVSAPASMVAQSVTEATGSPIAGMVAGTATGAAGGVRPRKMETAPSSEQLKEMASIAYKESADAGAVIKPESLQNAGQNIVKRVSNKIVIDPEVDTQAMAVIRRLNKTFDEPQTLEQLDLTRQFIRDAQRAGGRDARFAKEALKEFDAYIEGIGSKDLLAGDSKKAISSLNKARDLWKRSQKVQVLDDIFSSADLRASANYSQSGMEQALRRKLVNLADSEDIKFFSKTEQEAIRAAAKGGSVQNFLRWAGKVSPSSVVAGAGGAYIGASLLGPTGAAIVPIVGYGAKKASERMELNRFKNLQDMLALGRPAEVTQGRMDSVPATTLRGLLSTQDATRQFIEQENPLGF